MSRQLRAVPQQSRPNPIPKTNPGVTSPVGLKNSRSGRESVESFVLVFLGFLVWSLEAEGFVIPTGSMAPTLMGRHKLVECPQCDYRYAVNADREVEASGPTTGKLPRVGAGSCVNCRFETSLSDSQSFAGDRIYVMKSGISLPFSSTESQVKLNRWDVGVFKLPENPDIRYIKRTVGMPGDVIRIQGGDLWFRPRDDPSVPFERLRRPLEHQQAMQMMVHDDGHRPRAMVKDPRWRRWAPVREGNWTEFVPGSFRASGGGEAVELRYRHLVPEPEQWRAILEGRRLPYAPRASLITDFYSYNTDVTAVDGKNSSRPWFQPDWVGDLTVSARLKVDQPSGRFRIDLIRAGVAASCEVNLATGEAILKHGSEILGEPAKTGIRPGGTYDLIFSNVDERITLAVDGAYPFGEGRTYRSPSESLSPTAEDLSPVRFTATGGVELSRLVLKRDIHYTLEPTLADETILNDLRGLGSTAFFDLISNPARFVELDRRGIRDYPIADGCYMMLGDNSPWSRDSRAWGLTDQIRADDPGLGWDDSGRSSWEVPEKLVLGKAFCVFWPSATPVWPKLRVGPDLVIPVRPSWEKIRWIR